MDERFQHLRFEREEPVNDKRPGPPPPPQEPVDRRSHGRGLARSLGTARQEANANHGGFDDRKVFRFTVSRGFYPEDLIKIAAPEFRNQIEIVSQEEQEIVVAFISDAALESFEGFLATLIDDEVPKNQQVFYALRGINGWTEENRKGHALKQNGFPEDETFILDVELWPLEDSPEERTLLWQSFENWLEHHGIEKIDTIKQPGMSLYRVRCNRESAENLLHHRDVRLVDLPPKFGVDMTLQFVDIQNIEEIPSPSEDAPVVTVLDSGIVSGHPLLASAVGDAESFIEGKEPNDEHGHGTLVSGLSLYGDVERCAEDRSFVPDNRLGSARILDENAENSEGFIENTIRSAVEYFLENYGCKVFNLSFGDRNKPYHGGHVRELALTLDLISRELGVLFVVSTGNAYANQLNPRDWRDSYPGYLLSDDWKILDPATSLNSITVGSLARYDQTRNNQRYQDDPAELPIARKNMPSPFTRSGPSVKGAIKPDVVAYGGNWAYNGRSGTLITKAGLGESSTHKDALATGTMLGEESGTSFSAPHVAHIAAHIHGKPETDNRDLARALIAANARIPDETKQAFDNHTDALRVAGYGMVDQRGLFDSMEDEVTLISTSSIENRKHHFYEVPVPDDFIAAGARTRELTVALAYTPYVRSTRIDYRATRVEYKLVAAGDLDEVVEVFNRETARNRYDQIKEIASEIGTNNREVSSSIRNRGTLQASTWLFSRMTARSVLRNKRLFLVVTRNDFSWGEAHSAVDEDYALVISFKDRENENANLYSQVRNKLQGRQRARATT